VAQSRDKSTRSSRREQSRLQKVHLQKAQTLPAETESACAKPEKSNTRKALTLKRPAAAAAAVLEARKRRFDEAQVADSRSVCIRSSSASAPVSCTRLARKLSPVQYNKSKQRSRDVEEAVTADVSDIHSKLEERGVERTSGKTLRDASVSDISDPSSADSSMSLEDISEDDTPRGRDKHFVERSDLGSTQPGRGSEVGKQQRSDGEDVTSSKTSTVVSSVVRPVKKDAGGFQARHSVQTVTRLSQPTSEAQSSVGDSSAAVDTIGVRAAVRKG